MKNALHLWAALFAFVGMLGASPGHAQSATFSEDFTGASTINNWYLFRRRVPHGRNGRSGVEPGSGAFVHVRAVELLLRAIRP